MLSGYLAGMLKSSFKSLSSPRRQFIEKNALEVQNLDI
jgi:hypothetical protein